MESNSTPKHECHIAIPKAARSCPTEAGVEGDALAGLEVKGPAFSFFCFFFLWVSPFSMASRSSNLVSGEDTPLENHTIGLFLCCHDIKYIYRQHYNPSWFRHVTELKPRVHGLPQLHSPRIGQQFLWQFQVLHAFVHGRQQAAGLPLQSSPYIWWAPTQC